MQSVSICWPNVKILLILSISSVFTYIYIFRSQSLYKFELKYTESKINLQEEVFQYCTKNATYAVLYRKKERLPKQLKYILLWTRNDYAPFSAFQEGQKAFIQYHCPVIDCYVTNDRKFFGNDLSKFDAIAFNGRNLAPWDLPSKRYDHQKYVYVNMESARNYPVCNRVFENFFNWTLTYKLKSDIVFLYLKILDMQNNSVGPKRGLKLRYNGTKIGEDIELRWITKSKAVAWMVSNCRAVNEREKLVKRISSALNSYNLSLDVFGKCGKIHCSKEIEEICWNFIEKHYYFYLAFENSNSKDYVTEKLLNAVLHLTIPIVFGGARYSRFLPHGSYLDISKMSVEELVSNISNIISSEDLYKKYFRWRSVYKYSNPGKDYVCGLCSALHNKTMFAVKTTYKKFREWWYETYEDICKEEERKKRLRIFFTSPTIYFTRT